MKYVAIIPARGGSKGVPNKNIRLLAGKPLIAYAIETALTSNMFEDIIVSTDSDKIADVALAYGATVPFMRPDYLATDRSRTIDAVIYTLDRLRDEFKSEYDATVLLQPTAPLRNSDDISKSISLFEESKMPSLVSIAKLEEPHPYKLKKIVNGMVEPFLQGVNADSERPRQELPECYFLNGAIYITESTVVRKDRSFFGKETSYYIMPNERSVNIDTEIDFKLAEVLINCHGNSKT